MDMDWPLLQSVVNQAENYAKLEQRHIESPSASGNLGMPQDLSPP